MSRTEHKNLLRLHVSRETISGGENHEISDDQLHYLRNVMRMEAGGRLRVFNGRNGEWLAEVEELGKKKAVILFLEKLREQETASDIWAVASPIKKEAFDFMVEKAAELGAARFLPVACQRTVVTRINQQRLNAISIEASEQCERLDVMQVGPLETLEKTLSSWPSDRKLIFCIERDEAPPLAKAIAALPKGTSLGVLVGPEGGFTEEERAAIRRLPFTLPVSLGTRILRAETALIAALSGIQLGG